MSYNPKVIQFSIQIRHFWVDAAVSVAMVPEHRFSEDFVADFEHDMHQWFMAETGQPSPWSSYEELLTWAVGELVLIRALRIQQLKNYMIYGGVQPPPIPFTPLKALWVRNKNDDVLNGWNCMAVGNQHYVSNLMKKTASGHVMNQSKPPLMIIRMANEGIPLNYEGNPL